VRVGVDVDGVLSAFEKEFVDYMLTVPGMEHCTLDKIHPTWSFYKGWEMTTEEFLRHFREGVDAGHIFSRAKPEEGAVEATHRLHEAGHTVHIVTDCSIGTHGSAQRARAAWLARNEFYFDSITFTADKRDVKTDVFIDDKVENYIALRMAGTMCYLVDRPWNQHNHPAWPQSGTSWPVIENPDRVKSIVEFADILTKEDVYA
jgi:5'(3')-deoxyribonucleotidase